MTSAQGGGMILAQDNSGVQIELMHFFENGNIVIPFAGTSNRLLIGSGVSGSAGNGTIMLANAATVPAGNPTGGGFLYADAGALKWRGSSGTITTIAPA